MKNLINKKALVFTLILIIGIFVNVYADAGHGGRSGGRSFGGHSGYYNKVGQEYFDDMVKMRELMWKREITEDEYNQIIELQKKFMGYSLMEEEFKNVKVYNKEVDEYWEENEVKDFRRAFSPMMGGYGGCGQGGYGNRLGGYGYGGFGQGGYGPMMGGYGGFGSGFNPNYIPEGSTTE